MMRPSPKSRPGASLQNAGGLLSPPSWRAENRYISAGGHRLRLLILRPAAGKFLAKRQPAVLWLHGGGYATGMAEMVYFSRALPLVQKYGAVVVVPAYRLSGRAPYPAALEDCYAALCYLKAQAAALGADPNRLMVGGESAGGGLTAALCMLARDRGKVNIAFQMPLYPMLDDRDTDSSRENHGHVWNTRRNHAAWGLYLRDLRSQGNAPPVYAAPARQTDYTGLPPAYTFVGSGEPFLCETLAYVRHLKAAGVPARADVYKTDIHAFDMLLPWRTLSHIAARRFERQYLYAAKHYTAPNP